MVERPHLLLSTTLSVLPPDSVADLFIGDFDNDRVREVPCSLGSLSRNCTPPSGDTGDYIYTVAGNGNTSQTSLANNLSATGVTLNFPDGVLADPSENILVLFTKITTTCVRHSTPPAT